MKKDEAQRLSEVWKQYEDNQQYKVLKGYKDNIGVAVDYMEGRHWKKPTDANANLPRVIVNIVELITNNRISNVISTPITIKYDCFEEPSAAQALTEFNKFTEQKIKLAEIKEEAVERGAIESCSFVHFYWDENAVGLRGNKIGQVQPELIDIENLSVANPRETNMQKQDYIIISKRISVKEAKEQCENKSKLDLIVSDNETERGYIEDQDQEGEDLCTILIKYFKENNEVYFEKYTKTVVLQSKTPLNRYVLAKNIKFDDEVYEKEAPEDDKLNSWTFRAQKYPVAIYVYKKRKNCIYGRNEIDPLIYNQKVINFNYAMMSKSVEDNAWGRWIVKEEAVDDLDITNDPSRVIIDKYRGAGDGVKLETKQPFAAQSITLNNDIISNTRSVTGSTEVMTGEVMGSNQSGTSIAYLQQQAQVPLSKLIKQYRYFCEQIAEILMQFYIIYYDETEYALEEDNKISEVKVFNGKDYLNKYFTVTVEAGTGQQWTELSDINMLEYLLQAQAITIEEFIKLYPDNLLSKKNEILRVLESKNNVAALNEMLKQQQQQLEKASQVIAQQNEVTSKASNIINENKRLQEQLINLQAEYAQKIEEQNMMIDKYSGDAKMLLQYQLNQQANT